ncbi:hypothetical protein EBS80_02520 [bacterium]|nr:hypothetical protein [bacterium]
MTYRAAILTGFAVFFANALSLAFGWYKVVSQIDIPLHLAGGFAVGMLALAILSDLRQRKKLSAAPRWFDYVFTVAFVTFVAVLWEFHEFLLDHTLVWLNHFAKSQISMTDTMDDLLNGMIGGTVAFFCFYRRK